MVEQHKPEAPRNGVVERTGKQCLVALNAGEGDKRQSYKEKEAAGQDRRNRGGKPGFRLFDNGRIVLRVLAVQRTSIRWEEISLEMDPNGMGLRVLHSERNVLSGLVR